MVNTFEAAVVIVRDISPSPLDAANIGRGIFRARPSHDWRDHCIIGNVSKMRDILPHYRETHHFILLESEKVKYDGEENLGVVNVHQSFTPRPLSPRAGPAITGIIVSATSSHAAQERPGRQIFAHVQRRSPTQPSPRAE